MPHDVLEEFGLELVRPLSGGSRNQYWLAHRPGEEALVLRRYPEPHPDIGYELEVVRRLDSLGWPVPTPLCDPVVRDGRTWGLFRWLSGAPRTSEDERAQRERGRLLARLHDDMDTLGDLGQRAGWFVADEVVRDPRLHTALRAYEEVYPEDGRLLRWHAERAYELFERIDLTRPDGRRTVVHSDFVPWNLLYEGDTLTGVLDFDATHFNFAVGDFACAWRGRYDAVIEGYDEVRPLTDVERALITPVFWAWLLIGVADDVTAILSGQIPPVQLEWPLRKLVLRSRLMGAEAVPYRPAG
jgi:aminoglycoside phosphotransferase (APT) family kinase protein